ncbi:hypothetical protein K435DRAFT_760451 [Dendrothele bispora CBS 962.96]|uniref:DUF6593 domain-containing protein n=1 Tax=Dendrothele bispora (strain CBS 962.96) TaxID=1314807 RepID=A0A4S8LML7_DENBC|nr:hypothetical protein K435DRAFT_760451 [Dendrothele bispora CBS 962.96]
MYRQQRPLPYVFEDRTGQLLGSDFDDMYDRLFFRVSRPVPNKPVTMIYDMGRRATRHRDSLPFKRDPIAILEFGQGESLGNITYCTQKGSTNVSIPMNRYLRKTSLFGGSLSRKFTGSDGREYRWSYRTTPGQEWTLTTGDNYLVAHFDLKPPDVWVMDVSGNTLTVYETFIHLSVEILATLTIMRHIAQYNL